MDTTKTGKKIFLASLAVAAVACGDSNEPAGPVIPINRREIRRHLWQYIRLIRGFMVKAIA